MKEGVIPWIGGATLAGCAAFFSEPALVAVLVGMMLCYPLIDRHWKLPALPAGMRPVIAWASLTLTIALLIVLHPDRANFLFATLLLAALPEEWFFRAYFMERIGSGWPANVISSLFFALVHGLVRGPEVALLVFLPSLLYGWLYQRTHDLPLLILTHTLSNLAFVIYFERWFQTGLPPVP